MTSPTITNNKSSKSISEHEVHLEKSSTSYDLGAIDGIRTLACLAVMAFHAFLYWGTLMTLDKGYKILDSTLFLRLVMNANAAVDIFFILSGMWATMYLVPNLEQAAKSGSGIWTAIKSYYKKRIARILPAYATALLLVAFAIDHKRDGDVFLRRNHDVVFEYCPQPLPLNFALLNNLIGFGGCGLHFWSLTVQMHFYLAFPLILWFLRPNQPHFHRRIRKASIISFILCAALRYFAASANDVRLPLTPYAHPEMTAYGGDLAVRYYHTLYFASPARICNLATGIFIAMCMMNVKMTNTLKRYRFAISIATAAGMTAVWKIVLSSKLYGPPKEEKLWPHARAFAAFAYHGSPLYSIAFGFFVAAIALHSDPFVALFARILASRPIRHFSRVSYDVYLLHMAAMYWLEAHFLPRGWLADQVDKDPLKGWGIIYAGMCSSAYSCALVHNWIHSRVFRHVS